MSQRKTLQFSVGALLLLLPWFGGLVLGEVSSDFSQCLHFFFKRTPPHGITDVGYQPICQRYQNQYRFATLYHCSYRSALYSAYTVGSVQGKRPEGNLMYEPQLANNKGNPDMQPFPTPVDQNVIENQAVLKDYQSSVYTKGHLNPPLHQDSVADREATYTLTNIVPQRERSNSGPWNDLEKVVSNRFRTYCNGKMYVITGVISFLPTPRWIGFEESRVSVPEYMWSAYCCPSYKSGLPDSVKPFFPTYAAVGRNDPNSRDAIMKNDPNLKPQYLGYDVRQMSLEELESIIWTKLEIKISLF